MKKIIWVFGNAAVGKESFIRCLVQSHDGQIYSSVGIVTNSITVIEESISWVAYEPEHPTKGLRLTLPDVLRARCQASATDDATFVLKGQFVDLEAKLPEITKHLLPEAEHTIVYLDASPTDIFARLKTKSWFKESFTIERVRRLLRYEVGLLKKVQQTVPITVVESGNDFTYRVKNTPENISEYY